MEGIYCIFRSLVLGDWYSKRDPGKGIKLKFNEEVSYILFFSLTYYSNKLSKIGRRVNIYMGVSNKTELY